MELQDHPSRRRPRDTEAHVLRTPKTSREKLEGRENGSRPPKPSVNDGVIFHMEVKIDVMGNVLLIEGSSFVSLKILQVTLKI